VIVVSDMYYSRDQIEQLLEAAGYNKAWFDSLYVSSDCQLSKASGRIFPYIQTQERLSAKAFLHVGDHPKSDVKQANLAGWSSFHWWDADLAAHEALNALIL
jgi:predicted HAD superfamily hydrolase